MKATNPRPKVKQAENAPPKPKAEEGLPDFSGEQSQSKMNHAEKKKVVLAFEKQNYTRLFFLRDENSEWFKAFNNSATIFQGKVAKMIKSRVQIREDFERVAHAKYGFVGMKDMDVLTEKLEKVGIKLARKSKDLYVYNLGFRVPQEEITVMRQQNQAVRDQANKLIVPNIIMSTLYGDMRELYHFCLWTAKRMETPIRELVGRQMAESAGRLLEYYVVMAREDEVEIDYDDFFHVMGVELNQLHAVFVQIDAAGILDVDKLKKFAELVAKVRKQLDYERTRTKFHEIEQSKGGRLA